ncbi:VOC family protein [Streptomyces massasporeus]
MTPLMKLSAITLDCPAPLALAAFYQQATGLELHPESDAGFAALKSETGLSIGFQRAGHHRAPTWPDPALPQQLHCCFRVADLDEAEARLRELGAARPEPQPNEHRWRVLTDPAGHPFCIVEGFAAPPG